MASIYGGAFSDEESVYEFTEAGIVVVANEGPDTNGCQFFITLDSAPSLEGMYVAFGKVVDGMLVVRTIEATPVAPNTETPSLEISVLECGEL